VAEAKHVCGVRRYQFYLTVHENRLWALISALVRGIVTGFRDRPAASPPAAERLARDKQCAHIELSSSEKESERINLWRK
jgi:hypothetical protein